MITDHPVTIRSPRLALTQRRFSLSPAFRVLPRSLMASRGEVLWRWEFLPTIFVPGKLGFAQWFRPRERIVTGRKPLQHHPDCALWVLPPPPPLPPVSSWRLALGCVPNWRGVGRWTPGWVRDRVRKGNPRSVTVEDGGSRRVWPLWGKDLEKGLHCRGLVGRGSARAWQQVVGGFGGKIGFEVGVLGGAEAGVWRVKAGGRGENPRLFPRSASLVEGLGRCQQAEGRREGFPQRLVRSNPTLPGDLRFGDTWGRQRTPHNWHLCERGTPIG
jgi:hypothetical protein